MFGYLDVTDKQPLRSKISQSEKQMKWILKAKKNSPGIIGDKDNIVLQLLAERGITDPKDIKEYFEPDEKSFQNPNLMPDVEQAIDLIKQAKKEKWKVAVYGDYDVDGVCSTYILWDFLYNELKIDAIPYIPSRFDSGYGLNEKSLKELQANGVNLVISVDCGVKDAKLIEKLQKEGLKFIVTDHHTLPDVEDFVCPVVHPKRKISKLKFQDISGAATAWKLITAYSNDILKSQKYLDFVALASVCDVMPLIEENRAIVKLGLKQMDKTDNLGLRTLMDIAGLTGVELNTYHLGFVIGPRINAAGRIENALDVVRLFATKSQEKAKKIVQNLNDLNLNRQKLTVDTLMQAEKQIQNIDKDGNTIVEIEKKFLFVYGEEWHEGIIGLVAGKLAEKYYRPTIAATIVNGKVTGSARSIKNFDITQAITTQASLLNRFGGHSQAAGFSLDPKNIEAFKLGLEELAAKELDDKILERTIEIDADINADLISVDFVEELAKLEPFGYGNPRPIFRIKNLTVRSLQRFGMNSEHMRLKLGSFEAVCFNAGKHFENININDKITVVGSLDLNKWNGFVKVQVKLIDFKHEKQD